MSEQGAPNVPGRTVDGEGYLAGRCCEVLSPVLLRRGPRLFWPEQLHQLDHRADECREQKNAHGRQRKSNRLFTRDIVLRSQYRGEPGLADAEPPADMGNSVARFASTMALTMLAWGMCISSADAMMAYTRMTVT